MLLVARLLRQFAGAFRLPEWLNGLAVGALGDEAPSPRSEEVATARRASTRRAY